MTITDLNAWVQGVFAEAKADYDATCPVCDLYLRDGHADDCELVKLRRAVEFVRKVAETYEHVTSDLVDEARAILAELESDI